MTTTHADSATDLRSPSEVDQELADLNAELGEAYRLRTSVFDAIHNHVGDRRHFVGKKQLWNKQDGYVLIELIQKLKDKEIVAWNVENAERSISQLRPSMAKIKEIQAKIDALNAEYARRGGWSRFFSVTNANGHIHSSLNCPTTYPTTGFNWNPSLSGKTEEEAVQELGPILCSVCFPSAPTVWRKDPGQLRSAVKLRSNKRIPPGIFCKVWTRGNEEKFKTPRTAQIWATREIADHKLHSNYDIDEIAMHIVVAALALEWGMTKEETRALLNKKADEKIKRERG